MAFFFSCPQFSVPSSRTYALSRTYVSRDAGIYEGLQGHGKYVLDYRPEKFHLRMGVQSKDEKFEFRAAPMDV
jgi:hypothetical protein